MTLRRDFLLVQIEELTKVIAAIIQLRNAHAARKIPALIQTVYDSLKIDLPFLLTHSPEELFEALNQNKEGGYGRMEIAAKLLIEESYQRSGEKDVLLQKAKEILTFIQMNDKTFSIERSQLLNDLKGY